MPLHQAGGAACSSWLPYACRSPVSRAGKLLDDLLLARSVPKVVRHAPFDCFLVGRSVWRGATVALSRLTWQETRVYLLIFIADQVFFYWSLVAECCEACRFSGSTAHVLKACQHPPGRMFLFTLLTLLSGLLLLLAAQACSVGSFFLVSVVQLAEALVSSADTARI